MTALEEIKKAIAKSIDEGLLYFTDEECDVESEVHGFITKIIDAVSPTLESLQRDNEELRNLADRLKQEAQIHSMEARGANATVNEIYQIISGGKGEPANWQGAKPVREYVEAAKGEILRLETELALSKPVYSRRQIEERVKVLEAALKPFAEIDPINVYENEDEDANGRYVLTENQFRTARTALASTGGEHHAE
ncbi:hypothetical protein [Agrobacterium sp. M50-1]|uniref:hypothetical protein n=1 Tax=Agrobacterium sp. M50-1 TaxID=3132821 RepID=UPI003CE4BB75